MHPTKRASLTVAILLTCVHFATAAQQTANWLGGNGNWTDPTKWSGGVVPNNGADTYNLNIDNGNAVASTVNLFSATNETYTVDSLTLDSADRFNVQYTASLEGATGTVSKDVSRHVVVTFNGTTSPALQIGSLLCVLHLDTHSVDSCH